MGMIVFSNSLRTKVFLILLCISSSISPQYDARTLFDSAQKTYVKHGNTLHRGAIWGIDTVYLLGKLYDNKVPKSLTTGAFTALNYVGLLYLGSQYNHLQQQTQLASWAFGHNKNIACLAALAESFCAAVFLVDAIAMAWAATCTARGEHKSATTIYRTMLPFADITLGLTIGLDIYRLAQNDTYARATGASDLALRGLGYWSMATCRRNPNTLTQAKCWWGMATLYGIRSIMLGV